MCSFGDLQVKKTFVLNCSWRFHFNCFYRNRHFNYFHYSSNDNFLCFHFHTAFLRHLKRLEAHDGAVSTVHDEVFAVVPQQAVRHVALQLLRPPGHFLPLQRRAAAHLHTEDRWAAGELLWINTDSKEKELLCLDTVNQMFHTFTSPGVQCTNVNMKHI